MLDKELEEDKRIKALAYINQYTEVVDEINSLGIFEEAVIKAGNTVKILKSAKNALENMPRVIADLEKAIVEIKDFDISLLQSAVKDLPGIQKRLDEKRKEFFDIDEKIEKLKD